MKLNYQGLFVIMGFGNKSCKDDLFSYIFQPAKAALTTSSQMQSECQCLTLHLYRRLSHQKSCQGVRCYRRLKWTSKKPNCCWRAYIPDFAVKKKKCMCLPHFLILCIDQFFWGEKASGKCYPVSWQTTGCRPHRAHQELEQGQT